MSDKITFAQIIGMVTQGRRLASLEEALMSVEQAAVQENDTDALSVLSSIYRADLKSAQDTAARDTEAIRRISAYFAERTAQAETAAGNVQKPADPPRQNPAPSAASLPQPLIQHPTPIPSGNQADPPKKESALPPKPAKKLYDTIDPKKTFTADEAAAVLSRANEYYTAGVVRRMSNAGHLVSNEGIFPASSLIDHLKYMEGKRFLEQIPQSSLEDIAKKASKARTESVDLDFVRDQILRGYSTTIGHAVSSPSLGKIIVVPYSDENLAIAVSKGIWMSAQEILDRGCPLDKIADVIKVLRENASMFSTKDKSRPIIGYITASNISLLEFKSARDIGLSPKAQIIEERIINNQKYEFDPAKSYSRQEVEHYLKAVHQNAFAGSQVINSAMRYMKAEKEKVMGNQLLAFIDKVNGMVSLTSTKSRLQIAMEIGISTADSGIVEVQLSKVLEYITVQEYIHSLPDVLPGKYLLKHEMPEFKRNARLVLGISNLEDSIRKGSPDKAPEMGKLYEGTDIPGATEGTIKKRQDLISSYDPQLQQRRLFLNEGLRNHLVEMGILDHGSLDGIRTSYERFIAEMDGWRLYNFSKLREMKGMDAKRFTAEYLEPLSERGVVRNLAQDLGLQDKYLWLLAQGYPNEKELYDTLGLAMPQRVSTLSHGPDKKGQGYKK